MDKQDMNFRELELPKFLNLADEMQRMIASGIVEWAGGQICLNTTKEQPSNYKMGCGSLGNDWDNSYQTVEDGITKWIVPRRAVPLRENEFTEVCEQFKATVFEEVINALRAEFAIGRVRLMKSEPKTCLSWHVDNSDRIHYPILTLPECFMVIQDEVKHMPADTWWYTSTRNPHTAFNASKQSRIHLVACVL